MQVVQQARIRVARQLSGQLIDAREQGQEIRLGIGRSHAGHRLIQLSQRRMQLLEQVGGHGNQ